MSSCNRNSIFPDSENDSYSISTVIIALFILLIIIAIILLPGIMNNFNEKAAIKNGEYIEESHTIEKIVFKEGEYGAITANIETEDDFLVLSIESGGNREPRERVSFERTSEENNEVKISKYSYKEKTWNEKHTIYINKDLVKELKKDYFKISGTELKL